AGQPHPMAAHRIDSALLEALGRGADVREGVTSFLEKRRPTFPNRVPADLPPPYPWWEDREFCPARSRRATGCEPNRDPRRRGSQRRHRVDDGTERVPIMNVHRNPRARPLALTAGA